MDVSLVPLRYAKLQIEKLSIDLQDHEYLLVRGWYSIS
jgi:hypothetical protein